MAESNIQKPAALLAAAGAELAIGPTGRLAFRTKAGHAWQGGALCVLHYYDRQHPRAQSVAVPWDDAATLGTLGTPSLGARSRIAVRQTGPLAAEAVVEFDPLQIRLVLDIRLAEDGEGFEVAVPSAGVAEELPRLYRLLSLELLPDFGAARTGEAGYLTLPNWFGCQTFFDKAYPREVRQTVYSSNDQWENVCNAPVFAITRDRGTLCGLITEGDRDARLVCRRHWEEAQANGAHPDLVWRWEQQDDLLEGERRVRYRFAPPEGPRGEGYAFAACEYRRLLREERGLLTWAQKRVLRPAAADYAGRFFLKIFMAYKDPHPEGKGDYHCTCTCAEAQAILEQSLARGMRKLTVVLVGWGQEGHDGKCPTYLPVDDRVGGSDGMRRLVEWAARQGILLGVHTSHAAAYPCSPEFSVDDLVRHRTGEYWESIIWSGGRAHRVCPEVSLNRHVMRDLPALAELGIRGHHHYDAVGGFMCCHSPAHPVTRRSHYIDLIRREFRVALDVMGSVSTEMPFGQYFDVVDGYFHSFSNPGAYLRNCAAGRHFLDRSVPFLGITLHNGCLCGEAIGGGDPKRRALDMLDLGLSPQYEVACRAAGPFGIPAYDSSAARLEEAYRLAFGEEGYMALRGQDIEGRWEPAPGVSRTLYGDGTVVRVNRSERDWEDVPAFSFRIEKGTKQ